MSQVIILLLLAYIIIGIIVAIYFLIDDIKHYHIIKFNLKGVMTIIAFFVIWPYCIMLEIDNRQSMKEYSGGINE